MHFAFTTIEAGLCVFRNSVVADATIRSDFDLRDLRAGKSPSSSILCGAIRQCRRIIAQHNGQLIERYGTAGHKYVITQGYMRYQEPIGVLLPIRKAPLPIKNFFPTVTPQTSHSRSAPRPISRSSQLRIMSTILNCVD